MNNQTRERQINIERDVNVHFEDRKKSRAFFWFMWIIYAVIMMTKTSFNGAMADIVYEGFLTKQQTGFIIMAFYIVYTPLQIFGGIAADKFSPERLIEIGLLGGAISNAVIYLNQSYTVMLIAWVFNGISQFALWASIFKVVSSQCVRSDREKMLFYLSLSPTAGMLLSYAVAGFVPKWQLNFAISAIALGALLIILLIFDRYANRYLVWDKEEVAIPSVSQKNSHGGTLRLFYSSGFIFILVCLFLRDTVSQSARSIGPTLLMETFNTPPSVSTLLNVLVIVSCGLGVLGGKALLGLRIVKNLHLGIISLHAIALVGCVSLYFAQNLILTVASLCIIAFASTATFLFTNILSSAFAKYGKNATAAGLSNFATSIGFIATSGATLSIAENRGWGAVKLMLVILMATSILATLFSLILNKKFEKEEGKEAES